MKHVKRILALILVFCMVCSVLPTVWADDAPAGRTIDFTNPADAGKFTIDNQTVSEIKEGEGLYMISTNEAIEDCKGQLSGDAANTPRDTIQIPVAGDWTATLALKVDTSGSNGNYEFLCLYGMADYDNGCGIRAGANSTVNFKEVDGVNESSITGMKVSTGLTSGENHWYRLEKAGTTYTGYLSADGEEFQKVFTYEDTGIEAAMIVIDAYSGSSTGYQYWLQSLTIEGGEVEPEQPAGVSIDFTDPADASKFTVDNQAVSEIKEGEGFYMISTNEAIEDCKGQLSGDAANTPRDTIQVPVSGDWTATLYLKVDTSGSNGQYEFLCLYGMADYDNGCGIRAGANSTVNFKEVDGVNESSIDGMKVSTGLTSGEYHWYRLEKAGTTYTGYLSADGEEFQKVFTYEDTGIEASMIVIDAYSGRSTGYQYWLQSLDIESGDAPVPCEHDYVAVVTEPTCTVGGYTTYTCSKCGDSYVADEVAALGHDYQDGVCTRCGAIDPASGEGVPTIAGITLDGQPMEGFEPLKFDYQLNADDYETAPVVGYLGGGSTLLITGSDFQDPATSYTRSDYARNGDYTVQQDRIKAIVGNMKESLGTASYFIGGGDYNFDEIKNSVDRTNTGIAKTLEAVQQVCGTDIDATFIQGNHDAAGSNCAPTGPCDKADFGMFTIMEEDYRSYPQDSGKWSDPQNSEAKAQAVADKLDAYLAEKTAAGFDKPVFIACHVPIHYNTRTKNKADAIYGDVIYKTLYKYGDDLNIIFLYGHNHAWGDDDYLGGAANFLTRGDTINIAKHGSRDEFTVEPLNFTYMNYGYTGYYWAKWASSSSQVVINDAADSTLTMTAFQISGNQVIISRWDENGMHNLKSVGVASLGLRPEAEVCEPDPRVIESPVTAKAPKNPSAGSGLQVTVKQFEGIPGVATVTVADPASDATSVYTLTLESASGLNLAELKKAIAAAEAIDKSKYTDETVAALEAALEAAKALQTDAEADQAAVDAATEALNAAEAALEAKPVPQPSGKYVLASEFVPGGTYVIVADDAVGLNGELGATAVTVEGDTITSEVTADMLWTFEEAEGVDPATDGNDLYFITNAEGINLRRGSGGTTVLQLAEYDAASSRYFTWSLAERTAEDSAYTLYVNGTSSYIYYVSGTQSGFNTQYVSSTGFDPQTSGSSIKLYEPAGGSSVSIDFTKEADKSKYDIAGQSQSDVEEGVGLALVSSQGGIEPAKQNIAEQDIDVVKVPVSGDWTATLEVEFDANGAANGYYQFFGFVASEGGDNQNLVGIRGGDGAIQDFIRKDGAITEEQSSSAPGFDTTGKTYYLRIEKAGDTYTCYRSDDGEAFTQMFAYEGTGIEADELLIDAYTGMTAGYKFTLKSLDIEGVGGGPCDHNWVSEVVEPTCTEGGYTLQTCSKCGKTKTTDKVPALGHDWVDGEILVAPTATEFGKQEMICSRCGEKTTKTLLPTELTEGPSIVADPDSPTGYMGRFVYKNDAATSVTFAGDIMLRNDVEREADNKEYSPFDYRPGLMRAGTFTDTMTNLGNGYWYYEVPLACGANQYWFYVNGDTNTMVPDPANTPIWSPTAQQKNGYNYVYVPYDEKQDYEPMKLREAENPRSDGKVGTWGYVPIEIGGTTHHMGVYLPYQYDENREEPYKLIFVLHGYGQDESDWMNIGSVQKIMDNLAAEGRTEPAIIVSVTTNNNEIGSQSDNYSNLMNVILPFLEEKYNISDDPMNRAFCGLSMGSMNTQNIINGGADRFGYFGPFSGGMRVNADAPGLKKTHIFFGTGWSDTTVRPDHTAHIPLQEAGYFIEYRVVTGGHDFNAWCQLFRIFCEEYAWNPAAFGDGDVPPVDTTALAAAIDEADGIDTAPYTEASVKALEEAVAAAKEVLANENATQTEVNRAAAAVKNAIEALEEKSDDFLFEDVKDPGKFYFDPVYWAYKHTPQITKGTDDTHFGPDNACTRGHVVTFLWRAAGEPEPKSTQTPFTDLKPGAFYEKAVAWAVEEGITKGMTDTTFAPDGKCNRGQIVTFLWRFKGEPAPKSTQTPFTDLKAGAFYENAVAWAVENNVTKGMTETTFGPDATCTRGQVVTFLYRATQD
ncbi:MAG: hypothetical protein E7424_03320 [Ruminococcaceae bacterium]|nr:hypothetical protein [Oscillospiraceae bacterium]